MKRFFVLTALVCVFCAPAHAWFFFIIPGGVFGNNDKAAIEEYEKKGEWAKMLYMANKRLEVDPKNPGWHYLAALSHQRMNNCPEAIPMYAKAIELKSGGYPEAAGNMQICRDTVQRAAVPLSFPPIAETPAKIETPTKSIADRLRELKQLRDESLITQDVYEAKQKEILQAQ